MGSERLFVDLVFRSSNKYPNWDPEVPIEVGDYGRITQGKQPSWWNFWAKRTQAGVFLKEGNIFKEGIADRLSIPAPVEHGAVESSAVASSHGQTWITSKNAKEVDVGGEIGAQTPILLDCSVKAAYKFSSGKGALLVMDNDTITTIDPPGCLSRLLNLDEMQDRVVVSEVHKTSSYARVITTQDNSTVGIGLTVAPLVEAIGSVSAEAKWVHSGSAVNFKAKVNKDGKKIYYPLFRLSSLKSTGVSTGLRGSGWDITGDEPSLPDATPPWFGAEEG